MTALAQNGASLPRDLAQAVQGLSRPDPALAAELQRALAEELPAYRRDGGFVRAGYEAALDEARALRDECAASSRRLQVRYAERTGIRSLKIKHNNVLGYFVDITAPKGDKLMSPPLNATFIHRQTTAGQVRFTTTELGELEAKIASAAERALAIEVEIFDRLAAASRRRAPRSRMRPRRWPRSMSRRRSPIAVERDYVRPEVDASLAFAITGGRHPVVEQALGGTARPSSPTTAICRAARIWLVTGPNMAGKSTFLRQNALIAVLAQIGSFVPARAAHIGVVDRLFSRVGAADDLARGRSTFMVEMVETAAILNQAAALRWSSWTRSAAAPRPTTASPSPGRRRASARSQPLPRAVRHALSRADRAAPKLPRLPTSPCGSRNGTAKWCSCTRPGPAPPTAPTASRWPSWPACRPRWSRAPAVLARLEGEDRPRRRS